MINIGDTYGDLHVIDKITCNLYLCKCKCGIRKRLKKDDLINNYSDYVCTHRTNVKDISNQTFGDWIVLYPTKAGYWMCECQCEARTRREVYGTTLRSGESTSCGHSTTGFKDLKGQQFGEWIVLEYAGNHYWRCQCSCKDKTIRDVHRYSLINGRSTSCGCKSVENIQKSLINSGHTQYRTDDQIKAVSSKENMERFIRNLKYKPTISNLSTELSLNRSSIGVYIHKYKLEELVDIEPAVSQKEIEILEYIKSLYNKDIICNSRILIAGKEIDIYIPDKNVAIEFNGNYWHSDIFKDIHYHQQKTIECIKNKARLIHIFEYEWDDIVTKVKIKDLLKDILCDTKKIYARDTLVKNISNQQAIDFENKYHLSGGIKADISLGCFYNNELLGVMTFGKPRFDNDNQFEMIRMCFKSSYRVLGGAGKLLKTFIRLYNPESIVTYCDLSKFDGNSYLKLGFTTDRSLLTRPGYVWVNSHGTEVISRYKAQKHKLIAQGLGTKEQTEDEIMKEIGYFKIYNSGNQKFIMKLSSKDKHKADTV